jgi:hypothetical protein
MTNQMAMRLKKLATIYRVNGLESGRRPVTEGPLPTPSAGFIERVHARIEQDSTDHACASVVAVDLSGFEGDHHVWMTCVNRLASELTSQEEQYLVDMLEDRRFVIVLLGAWEGEAVRLVRTLRSALWRHSPAFGVAPMTPGAGVAEVMELVLAKAHRAASSSVSARFGEQSTRTPGLMPVAA